MKLKKGFIVREIAGETVVLPSGDDLDLSKMFCLNETARFLWNHLEEGAELADLVNSVLEEYAVDRERAEASVSRFVTKLNENGFLE